MKYLTPRKDLGVLFFKKFRPYRKEKIGYNNRKTKELEKVD